MVANLGRPWNITEQVVEDPTTKLRIEFTSVHSEAVKGGQAAPDHDKIIYLRLWTSDRTRVATYAFTRGGQFIKTAVEHTDPGNHPALDAGIEKAQLDRAISGDIKSLDSPLMQQAASPANFGDINYADQFVGDM